MRESQNSREPKPALRHWRKVRVLCAVLLCFRSLYRDIQLYGASCPFYTLRTPRTRYSEVKSGRDHQYILHTKSLLRQVWSAVLYLALVWSATVSVFLAAFLDVRISPWMSIEEAISLLCLADIGLTTISTYKNSSHVAVVTISEIANHYLRSYLVIDVLAW